MSQLEILLNRSPAENYMVTAIESNSSSPSPNRQVPSQSPSKNHSEFFDPVKSLGADCFLRRFLRRSARIAIPPDTDKANSYPPNHGITNGVSGCKVSAVSDTVGEEDEGVDEEDENVEDEGVDEEDEDINSGAIVIALYWFIDSFVTS